ncbi:glycosyltransferase family 2 protein [Paramaledivibacter caminithermalis]|jgi:hypothetical protein|uniref:Glycosyl transferase family 2 n=1 Tax=Paramaledivibacter caminithermalis (strain DSM 15212 / CIP 107654 / DViRD3) TaxID=1121301 RepID=A0A1M6JUY3_PARC5|nr:glycosyltransferase family 2 protein [Paramaledivibacter caminithermalis]SHJ50501.1 Glycosyl transferase family 2 [Paramaledivibacter caminithermalis DSM 15212]
MYRKKVQKSPNTIIEFGDSNLDKSLTKAKIIENNNINDRKVFSFSMVKNEADIIESFVRYHCNIFDGMVIKDNCSSDNTLNILEKLKSEGKPIYILRDNNTEYTQSVKMTKLLYYTIKKYNPDILIPLDADEFLTTSDNSGNPKKILNKISLDEAYRIKWRNYIPNFDDNKDEKFIPKRIRYARWKRDIQGIVIIPKDFAHKNPVRLVQGNHTIFIGEERKYPDVMDELIVAHYPVRSVNQIKSKILVGWINELSRYDTDKPDCWHWGMMYRDIKDGKGDLSQRDLIKIAKNYNLKKEYDGTPIYFPIDISFCKSLEIKYTGIEEIKPLKNVLDNCEILAKEYAFLKKKYMNSNVNKGIGI